MLNKYLPLGTVCLLKGAKTKVMIIGYNKNNYKRHILYDYIACEYPNGISSKKDKMYFLHNKIDKVFFIGYNDSEQKKLLEKFNSELKRKSNDINNVVINEKKKETVQINTLKKDEVIKEEKIFKVSEEMQKLLKDLPSQ